MSINLCVSRADSSSVCEIPGSKLSTGIWYTIDMPKYSPGYLTWSTKDHHGDGYEWYLFHVFRLSNPSSYEKGGMLFDSTLWEFLPSSNFPGWYRMRNKHFTDCFVTWSTTNFVNTHNIKNVSKYLILENGRAEEEYMIKPVLVETEEQEDVNKVYNHQLTMKLFPTGEITWTQDTYNSHFIQNDHRDGDPADMKKYKKGGKWFDDTLFIFKPVESSDDNGCFEKSSAVLARENVRLVHVVSVCILINAIVTKIQK